MQVFPGRTNWKMKTPEFCCVCAWLRVLVTRHGPMEGGGGALSNGVVSCRVAPPRHRLLPRGEAGAGQPDRCRAPPSRGQHGGANRCRRGVAPPAVAIRFVWGKVGSPRLPLPPASVLSAVVGFPCDEECLSRPFQYTGHGHSVCAPSPPPAVPNTKCRGRPRACAERPCLPVRPLLFPSVRHTPGT